jgi:hypothetical protein
MKNHSLLKRFTLLSFFPFLITGVILSFFVSSHIREEKIQNVIDLSHLTLDTLLLPELSTEDLSKPFTHDKLNKIGQKLNDIKNSYDVIAIKIWDAKGHILYSDDPALL